MNGRRLQFGVAVIDDKLFVIGGRDGLKTLNTVECYNPKTKTWTVLPPMSTHRHGLGKIFYFIDTNFRKIFINSENIYKTMVLLPLITINFRYTRAFLEHHLKVLDIFLC